jgi:hypothetical protein
MSRLSAVVAVVGLVIGLPSATPAACQDVSPGETALRLLVETPQDGVLARAVARQAGRLATPSLTLSIQSAEPRATRSWIARHPALFGALVGAGGGALAGASLGHDCGTSESFCSRDAMVGLGAAAGAGAGAVVGVLVGAASK